MKKRALSLLLVGLLSISSVMPALAAAPENSCVNILAEEMKEDNSNSQGISEKVTEEEQEVTAVDEEPIDLYLSCENEPDIFETELIGHCEGFEIHDCFDDLGDSDELFSEYVGKVFNTYGGEVALFSLNVGNRLPKYEKIIYEELLDMTRQVADGECENAEFLIPLSAFFDDYFISAEELGLDYVWDGQNVNPGTGEAVGALLNKLTATNAVRAIMADEPYLLYWFDKAQGWSTQTGDISYWYRQDGVLLEDNTYLSITMSVSANYSVDKCLNTTKVDTEKTKAAKSAAANAKSVISEAATHSDCDYDTLDYYRQWICDHNTYNSHAADDNNNVPYGDPWQLIYVFDGDDSTNVVCEGYAKAFQYLCDNTQFNSPEIVCYTVEGKASSGSKAEGHMWNIMHMDDGYNYHTDITWCDPVTADGSNRPNKNYFLIGADGGSVEKGYWYYDNDHYVYDSENSMMSLYTKDDLTIRIGADYDPDYNPVVPERPLQMESFSLGLNDTGIISLYIYMSGLKEGFSEVYIDGKLATDCSEMQCEDENEYDTTLYRYTIQKAVKDIYEDVTISVYENDELVPFEDGTYINADGEAVVSIYDYIDVVTANEEKKFSQELVDLCQALLVCGDNAKGYFDSEYTSTMESDYSIYPDKSGNDPLAAYDVEFVRPSDNYSGEGSDPGAGLTFEHAYAGSSLILGSTVTVRHYFTEDVRSLSDESKTYNANWFYKKKADGIYYAQFGVEDEESLLGYRGLPIADLNKWVVADFDGFQIKYSPFCYMKKARDAENVSAELMQVLNSLYGLWYYADVYFQNKAS